MCYIYRKASSPCSNGRKVGRKVVKNVDDVFQQAKDLVALGEREMLDYVSNQVDSWYESPRTRSGKRKRNETATE